MIPSYLSDVAQEIKSKDDWTKMIIKCPCGCDDFLLYKKHRSKQENDKIKELDKQFNKLVGRNWHSEYENGTKYVVGKKFFGLFKVKVEAEEYNAILLPYKNYVSVKCVSCGNEYVLFDERFHGYDAVISEEQDSNEVETCYKANNSQKIELTVYYNEDNDEDDTLTDKTIAYGRIKITKVVGEKKLTVIDCECE